MCDSAIANLKLLIEYEEQAKVSINELTTNNRKEFSEVFTTHNEENEKIINHAKQTRKELSDQIDILSTFLRKAFETYESDHNQLKQLVR